LGLRGARQQGSEEDYLTRSFMICAAHNFIRVTKSIKMRWAGHVARMGERRGAYRVSVGRPERKTPVPMTEA
jgi:hypothetical protein